MQQFQIMTDRLNDGEEDPIDESLDPSFLDLAEHDELKVHLPVHVKGKVYKASEWIIVDAVVSVTMTLTCAMCNESFSKELLLKRWVHEEKVPQNGVLDLKDALREDILLEVPFFSLCNGDSCHNIAEIQQFIRKEQVFEGHKPFLEALGNIQK